MKILLISGHGAGDPGATAVIDGVLRKEATETINVVKEIEKYLSKYADVTLYPIDRDAFSDYKNGSLGRIANFKNYNYVLEIHFNSCVRDLKGNGVTTGCECYVTAKETNTNVENAIVSNLSKLGFKNRGVKKQNFAVISSAKNAGVSSALLEVGFIDDADDVRLYTKKHDMVAKAISDGIVTGFSLKPKAPVVTGPDYATMVTDKLGLSEATKTYISAYKYSAALWKKIWEGLK